MKRPEMPIHSFTGRSTATYIYVYNISQYIPLCDVCPLLFCLVHLLFSLLLSRYSTRALSSYLSPTTRAYFHCCPFFFLRNLQYVYTRRIEVPSSHTRCIRSNREFLHFRTPIRVCIITARCSAKPGRTQYVLCTISV